MHRRGDEDLTALRDGRYPGRENHCFAGEVGGLADGLSDMETYPDLDRLVPMLLTIFCERALNSDCAKNGASGAGKRDHKAVAHRFDLEAFLQSYLLANDRIMSAQDLLGAQIAKSFE